MQPFPKFREPDASIAVVSSRNINSVNRHEQEQAGLRRPDGSHNMEHVAAIMMLVGCGYGNADCRELPTSTAGYETVEDCQEMLRPTVSAIETSAKVIYGKCEAVDPALFIEDANEPRIRWTVTPDEELHVSIDVEQRFQPVMLASR